MKPSILYIDDEPRCLSHFQEMFGGEYEVRTATTLSEARRLLAEHPADIVISDQSLPEIEGTDFLIEVAATQPSSYRVLLTSNLTVGDTITEIGAGIIHTFITKPWTVENMRKALGRASLDVGLHRGGNEEYCQRPEHTVWRLGLEEDKKLTAAKEVRSGRTHDMQALVVDDEPSVRRFVVGILRDEGWAVSEAETAERAFEKLHEQEWSLVFCDVLLGGEDGYAVLRRFTQEQPQARVILMTGQGSAAGALDATAFGAHDYLLKPFGDEQVRALSSGVRRRIEGQARMERNEAVAPGYRSDVALVGRSPALVEVMKMVGRVASTNLPILITGESGTGKEVVARAIHRRSRRAGHPFVAVNCGALPPELIESELFGHMRGSFTGAARDRQGLFEEARGGTVLLDEITETSPAFQVKLLRALQEGEIRRVGSNLTVHVDMRVIAATNRDPSAEVKEGRFRQDLLYRLNTLRIHLPPLRERREDILPLVRYFAERARPPNSPPLKFPPDTLRLLENYDWPGNIRELENVVIRAAALCEDTVPPEVLPENICRDGDANPRGTEEQTAAIFAMKDKEWPTMSEVEGRYVARVLAHTGGNKQYAARLLGVDRNTLKRMIERHNLRI